jgi:succinate dehydrogenase / fumarate reductase cytochrome b subunit
VPETAATWMQRNHFLLRRLHSLSGVVPVGVFLIVHLLTNSTAWLGRDQFNEHVEQIHNLPFLLAIEIVGIFLPLAFHAGYGIVIALESRPNVRDYPYWDNWRYTLQRVTAWVAFVYIIAHLLHYRFAHWLGAPVYMDEPDAFHATRDGFVASFLPAWAWLTIYVTGITASAYHLCNGLVTACITWGVTVGDVSRKRLQVAAAGLFVVLMAWGILSLQALTGAAERIDTAENTAWPGSAS